MPSASKARASSSQLPKADEKKSDPKVRLFTGDKSLTSDAAKDLLGWEEDGEKTKLGDDYSTALKSIFGRKIRTTKNRINRPWRIGDIVTYCQEILRGHWRLTLENIIISDRGNITDGQTRLAALILAGERWAKSPEDFPYWASEPTIEVSVAFGGSEDADILNVTNTGTPRTFADSAYRSSYFAAMDERARVKASKVLESAVRMLWHRTGCDTDAFAPKKTHAESFAFVDSHVRLLECVKHVIEEDGGEGKISSLINLGYAAAFQYLMATSGTTDPTEWHKARKDRLQNEKMLDFSKWDDAADFWVRVARSDATTKPIRETVEEIREQQEVVSNAQKWSVICNAWQCVLADEEITVDKLRLVHGEPTPTCGGIDLGDPEDDEPEPDEPEPTLDDAVEVEERKEVVKEKKKAARKLTPSRAGDEWAVGDVAWVQDASRDCDHYLAEVIDAYRTDAGEDRVMVRDAKDSEWDEPMDRLSLTEPPREEPTTVSGKPLPPKGEKLQTVKPGKAVKPGKLVSGKLYWVHDPDGKHWAGRLREQSGNVCKLQVEVGHQGAGNLKPALLTAIRETQP